MSNSKFETVILQSHLNCLILNNKIFFVSSFNIVFVSGIIAWRVFYSPLQQMEP